MTLNMMGQEKGKFSNIGSTEEMAEESESIFFAHDSMNSVIMSQWIDLQRTNVVNAL